MAKKTLKKDVKKSKKVNGKKIDKKITSKKVTKKPIKSNKTIKNKKLKVNSNKIEKKTNKIKGKKEVKNKKNIKTNVVSKKEVKKNDVKPVTIDISDLKNSVNNIKEEKNEKPNKKEVIKTNSKDNKEVNLTVNENKKPTTALDEAIALYNSKEYKDVLEELKKLRQDGDWKILKIKDENIDVKINKQLTKEGKKKLLEMNALEMKEGKIVSKRNKPQINEIVKNIEKKSKVDFTPIFEKAKLEEKAEIKLAKERYVVEVNKAKEDHKADLEKINEKYKDNADKKGKDIDLSAAKISYKSKLNAAKNNKFDAIQKAKENRFQTYQTSYNYFSKVRLNKHTEGESLVFGAETYRRNFNLFNWFTKNALFMIVGVVFLVMIILMGIGGSLNASWFLNGLTTIAPKIFFALGVAGLILLAGTDLSIGRLTAVGASFSLMILTDEANSLTWFPHLYSIGGAGGFALRTILALLVSIALCTLFTSISGFFTAKFKMHPFISTLAMQLIVYGFFQAFFSSVSAFTISTDIQEALAGKSGWLLLVYAAIAIIIVWFIWNKTKFGKNLYAVGGNPEAAAVSGINPFKITMLAFVMAGILYGCGGFVQALQAGSANFNSYSGTETDAIAACVIGGISFSGGVGSVLGAVGGAIILGFLTSCFNALNIDTNIQFVIKGLIILIAVTLDCVKYIRKK